MNAAATEIVITYERKKEVRQRIGRPMKDYVDGRKSVKALAEAMNKFNAETTGDGAANITSADMPRACGTFGTQISEAKMTAIIKFLTKTKPNPFVVSDIKSAEDFFCFVDGTNYVEAARQANKHSTRSAFGNAIGATEGEILDAEKGRLVRAELFEPYKKALKAYGAELKQAGR